MSDAWWIGRLAGISINAPKKYPAMPDLLWNKDADRQTPETMKAILLAVADNSDEFKEQLRKSGKLH